MAEVSSALVEKFGLHAELFSLAAMSAAIGLVRGVVDPAGGGSTPALQIVAHGKAKVILQRALRGVALPRQAVRCGARSFSKRCPVGWRKKTDSFVDNIQIKATSKIILNECRFVWLQPIRLRKVHLPPLLSRSFPRKPGLI